MTPDEAINNTIRLAEQAEMETDRGRADQQIALAATWLDVAWYLTEVS